MDKEELRLREKKVVLTNQNIIEILYQTREFLKAVEGQWLFFEDANCFLHNFYLCRHLLKDIDKEYKNMQRHSKVVQFFLDHEIDNTYDAIRILKKGEEESLPPSGEIGGLMVINPEDYRPKKGKVSNGTSANPANKNTKQETRTQ